jgi:hypothetical protein
MLRVVQVEQVAKPIPGGQHHQLTEGAAMTPVDKALAILLGSFAMGVLFLLVEFIAGIAAGA